jgi:AhpC/TSA family
VPCGKSVPHLNELHEKFAGQGLTIIGVTDEAQKITDEWVADRHVEYAYAFDKGGKLKRWFGIEGIPHAVLINPNGQIVWRGHPGELSEATLQASLAGALKLPLYEWPESAEKAAKAVGKRRFAEALEKAREIEGADGKAIVENLQQLVDAKLASVKGWMDAGDYLAVRERGTTFAKELSDLPQGDEIDALLKRMADDKTAQDVLAAQLEVRKLAEQKVKKSTLPRTREKLRRILQEHPGTAAARDAGNALDRLPKG